GAPRHPRHRRPHHRPEPTSDAAHSTQVPRLRGGDRARTPARLPHEREPDARAGGERRGGAVRPGARPRAALPRRPGGRGVRGLQDARRRAAARAAARDRRAVRRGEGFGRVRAQGVRRAAVRAPRAGGCGRAAGCRARDGGAHPRPLAAAHAGPRLGRRALVAHPAAVRVRGAGRALPRGVLLGLVLHDARPRRERADRGRALDARQLRPPRAAGGARAEREPHVLPEPEPAALPRRDGGAVRAGGRHRAGAALPRRARGRARVLDARRGAARARHRAAARGAAAERRAPQPLLGRPPRAAPGVVPRGLPPRRGAAGGAARGAVPRHPRGRRERLGLLQPVDARLRRPPLARDHGARAGGPQQPAVQRRAHDRRAAPRAGRARGRRGGRALRLGRVRAPRRPRRRRVRLGRRLLLRRALAHGRARRRPADDGRGRAPLLRARDGGAGAGDRGAAGARVSQGRRLRDDAREVGAAVGRAQRLAAAAVDGDRGRAPLRPRRPRRRRARPVARAQPPHVPERGEDDREVRRGGPEPARRWRRVPHAGRLRLDERRRARALGAGGGPAV
ncbi:MAG: GH37, partial [uncultured Gemmatimonadaceae bacterium]